MHQVSHKLPYFDIKKKHAALLFLCFGTVQDRLTVHTSLFWSLKTEAATGEVFTLRPAGDVTWKGQNRSVTQTHTMNTFSHSASP